MFARQHRRRRFQVEPPERSQLGVTRLLPFAVVIEPRPPRPQSSATVTTLAQHRLARRRALLITLACVVVAAAMGGGLSFAARTHTLAQTKAPSSPESSAISSADMDRERTQRDLA